MRKDSRALHSIVKYTYIFWEMCMCISGCLKVSGRSLLTTFCFQAIANQKNGDLKGGIKGKGAKMACFKEWIKQGKEPRPSIGQIRIILTCKSSKTTLIELMKKNRGETKHARSTLSKINKIYSNNNQI